MGECNPQAAAAVPVIGVHRPFIGALGVTGATGRTDQAREEEIRDILLTGASALSATLGGTAGNAVRLTS